MKKEVSLWWIILAVVVLLIWVGFLAWRYFGPKPIQTDPTGKTPREAYPGGGPPPGLGLRPEEWGKTPASPKK